MLKKEIRITSSKQYNNIYRYGRKIPSRYIIVYIKSNNCNYNRFGIVTSKKIGHATERNKVKRQLRSIVKKNLSIIKGSFDVVIIAKKNIVKAEFHLIDADYLTVMKKAGLC